MIEFDNKRLRISDFHIKCKDNISEYEVFITHTKPSDIIEFIKEQVGNKCPFMVVMDDLIESGLLDIFHHTNNGSLGNYGEKDHKRVLEDIRCHSRAGKFAQEIVVNAYIEFSHVLSNCTFGLIPKAFDPDRERVKNRFIPYEMFYELCGRLSDRDCLIAKLLYFGAPSVESTLQLRQSCINKTYFGIHFKCGDVPFPKHLMRDILSWIDDNGIMIDSYIFNNCKLEKVSRVHLDQALKRASKEINSLPVSAATLIRNLTS